MSASSKRVPDEQILRLFRESDDAFLTAVEVANNIDMTRAGVNKRLTELEDQGVLSRKRAGSRAVGWWLVD
jgi:biotin operon repressor